MGNSSHTSSPNNKNSHSHVIFQVPPSLALPNSQYNFSFLLYSYSFYTLNHFSLCSFITKKQNFFYYSFTLFVMYSFHLHILLFCHYTSTPFTIHTILLFLPLFCYYLPLIPHNYMFFHLNYIYKDIVWYL